MNLDREDAKQLLDEIDRFARKRIAQATVRPESPIDSTTLEGLTREAVDLGILSPSGAAEEGFGLWEHVQQSEAMSFNIGILRRIGYANAGVAFAWHRIALAKVLARELGVERNASNPIETTMVPTGHYGLARNSLARWIKGIDLQGDEETLLSDWLNRRDHFTTVYAPHGWKTLLWPIWQKGEVSWQCIAREDLQAKPQPAQHGLDELCGFEVRANTALGDTKLLGAAVSRQVYQRILKMDMVGHLAIAHGVLLRGQEMARDYAGIRRQGGKLIGSHAAVQYLLTEIEMARQQADAALGSFGKPLDDIDAGAVAATRIGAHEALCNAANQVMQVHGGSGYMRDTGPEKMLRDQNMLKLQAGGTRDAHLFVAGWIGDGV